MSEKITSEDIKKLYAPFASNEHEVREGSVKNKVQWFVYVRRQAIQQRLDLLFPGEWSFGFVDPKQKYEYGKSHVSCAMYLEIRGVRREFNGSQDGLGLNAEKGAATDALKRVASMWGMGLYLQDTPPIWTAGGYIDAKGKKDWKKRNAQADEALNKATEWLRSGVVPMATQDDTQEEPAQNGNGSEPKESYTAPTNIVGTRVSDDDKQYMVVEQCTFFSRDPFRKLGYDAAIITRMGARGVTELPDNITIIYTQKGDYKTPVRMLRHSTNMIVDIKTLEVYEKVAI